LKRILSDWRRKIWAIEEVLPMLKPYATEARSRFTLIYRGYDLEVTRAPSGWFVGAGAYAAMAVLVLAYLMDTFK
jgi:hypothetical protein